MTIIDSAKNLISGISLDNSSLSLNGLYRPRSDKRVSLDLLWTKALRVLYIRAANFLGSLSFDKSRKFTESPLEKVISWLK